MSRAESRDRRRTQSLKGRESFTLSKDMETKLGQLEAKVEQLLRSKGDSPLPGVSSLLCKAKAVVGHSAPHLQLISFPYVLPYMSFFLFSVMNCSVVLNI